MSLAPEELFRLLATAPRPWTCVNVLGLRIVVTAMTAQEADGIVRTETDSQASRLAILRRVVTMPDGSRPPLDMLHGAVVEAIGKAVVPALAELQPSYQHPAWPKTAAALVEGAKVPSNSALLVALGDSVDVAVGWSGCVYTDRPDRFYGAPLAHLTDGQWMAYRAARSVLHERRKNQK